MGYAFFGLTYDGIPVENWFSRHKVFQEGRDISSADGLYAEFRACIALGIDPEIMFAKDRHMRMMITGGVVADSAVRAMRDYDLAEERRLAAEAERRKK